MSDFNPDTELQNLLREQSRRQPFILESLAIERQALLEAFQDHVVAVYGITEEDFSVEAMLAPAPIPDNETISTQLNQLIHKDIERLEPLLSGEIRLSGHGMFLQGSEQGLETDHFEDGDVIHGEIVDYTVLPIVPYDVYQKIQNGQYDEESGDEVREDAGGLCVILEHAVHYDAAGHVVRSIDWVLAPVTYPSIQFDKVIRQHSDAAKQIDRNPVDYTNTLDLLNGDIFREVCTDIENDLTYNHYTADELNQQHQSHLDDISEMVKGIDIDQLLVITYRQLDRVSSETTEYADVRVHYERPSIMQIGERWTVLHTFSVVHDVPTEYPRTLLYVAPIDVLEVTQL